jgi:hypothetical protein
MDVGKSRKPPSQVNPTARKAWPVREAGSSPSPVSQHFLKKYIGVEKTLNYSLLYLSFNNYM